MKKNKKKYINKKTQNTFNMPCLYPTALNAVCKLHRISSANRGSHRIFLDSVYYYMLSHFSQQMESMHYSPHLLTARWEFRWPEARDTVLTRWFNDVKNIMFFTEKQQVVNWFQTSHEEGEIDLVFNMMEVEHQKNFIKTYTDAVAFVNRPECIDVEPQSIEHVGYDDIENAMTDTDVDSDDSMPSLIENSDEEEDSEEEHDNRANKNIKKGLLCTELPFIFLFIFCFFIFFVRCKKQRLLLYGCARWRLTRLSYQRWGDRIGRV